MENVVKKENKMKNLIIGIVVCVAILLLAVGGYFFFVRKDELNEPRDNMKNDNSIEVRKVYDFKDENNTGECVVIVDIDGNAYLSVQDSDDDTYKLLEKEYAIKNIGVYGNKKSFKAAKLNIYDVKDVSKVLYGNGPDHYLAFLIDSSSDGYKLYITHDYLLTMMTNDKLNNIKSVKSEEICDEEDGSRVCYLNAYAINNKNEKIDLYSDVENNIFKTELTEYNQEIQFNGKQITLKSSEGKIYYNDKLIKTFDDMNNFGVYVSEKMIFIYWIGNQCNPVFIGAINEKGEFVEVKNPNGDYVYDLYTKDGVVMGTGNVCQTEPEENEKYNAKFVYDGKEVLLTKVS